jgi:glycosyltransferase involved in cell wall biosynthesis
VQPEGWILEIVGPSENGHRAELERQAASLGIDGDVQFAGAVDDAVKWHKYAGADLFVLPSHSENFGIVVAEALAAGVPALTTTGTPWEELDTHDCGWWVDPKVDSITDALDTATRLSSDARRAMGRRGRTLVTNRYTWDAVGQKMMATYRWLTGDGQEPPSHVV